MGGVGVFAKEVAVSTKLTIVINEQRLRQLMLEFVAERSEFSSDDDTLRRQLLFSDFAIWLQRKQRGESTDGPNRNQRVVSVDS